MDDPGPEATDRLLRRYGTAAAHTAAETRRDQSAESDQRSTGRDLWSPRSLWSQAQNAGADWPALDPAALHGIAGKVVRTLDPHTEADPVSVLLTFLAAVGNIVGAGPHAIADAAPHPARLFVVLVGETSRARKGSAWQQVRRVLAQVAPLWAEGCTLPGLASGEALIAEVRDGTGDGIGAAFGASTDSG